MGQTTPLQREPATLAELIGHIEAGVGTLSDEVIALQRHAALGAVAGLMAHEVNSILTPMLAYASIARRPGASPEAVARALAAADEGARRVAEVMRAIMSLGRGGVGTTAGVANIAEVISLARGAIGRDLSRDGIACEVDVPEELRVAIAPVLLQQVLVNLLQNARTALLAARTHEAWIMISAEPTGCSTWNSDGVLLVFEDNGPGIPAEMLGTIFEPYVRAGPAGTGLGLTVCRELVAAAGGTIRCEPVASGTGARFTIRLPSPPR
jgi:signal transduction histidine kinase